MQFLARGCLNSYFRMSSVKRTSNHSEQRLFREEVLSFTSHIYMTLAILCRRRHKVAFKSRTESEIQFAIPSALEMPAEWRLV